MSEIQRSPFLAETFTLTKGFSKNALGSHFRIHKSCSLEGVYMHVVLAGAKILVSLSSCGREHNVLFRRRPLKEQLLHSTVVFGEHAVHLEIDFYFFFKLNSGLNLCTSVFVESCSYSQCTKAAEKLHCT